MNTTSLILLLGVAYLVVGIYKVSIHNNIATWRRIHHLNEGDAVWMGIVFWWKVVWDLYRNQKKVHPVVYIRRNLNV